MNIAEIAAAATRLEMRGLGLNAQTVVKITWRTNVNRFCAR